MTIPYMKTYALFVLNYLTIVYNHKYETKF